jgi:hypothetical protein
MEIQNQNAANSLESLREWVLSTQSKAVNPILEQLEQISRELLTHKDALDPLNNLQSQVCKFNLNFLHPTLFC